MSHTTLSLLQGTVDLLILRALQGGPAHGYSVSRWVRERTEGVLAIEDAALYQALHRLEAQGLVKSEWRENETGRDAKFYSLTKAGHTALETELTQWERLSSAIRLTLRNA